MGNALGAGPLPRYKRGMRSLLLTLLLLPGMARAQFAEGRAVLDAVRAAQWPQAEALGQSAPDPVVRRLVLYYRLLTPGAAGAAEIAAFMAESPDWPSQALLSRRLQEALAIDKDDRTVWEICRTRPPLAVPSMLRCADVGARAGVPEADSPARRAWVAGIVDAPGEIAFLKRWAGQITPDDQWRRFDRLAWTESPAPGGPAARQAVRLPPSMRSAAEARLALRRDDATAPALFATVPPAARDPGLVLELARWFRRAGQDRDAATVWTGAGIAAEQAAPPERRSAFWDERNLLARRMLRTNEPALAYAIVQAPVAAPDGAIDGAFLAGWIALRRLDRADDALRHFQALATLSQAAITQARAHYWIGRAQEAAGRDPQPDYARAMRWPTTYYGQLAALAAGQDPVALAAAARDPAWDEARAQAFLAHEPARAAVLLAAWGDARRSKPFLARLDELATDGTERAMAARLALGLGLPDTAVAIARRAGRDGVMLPAAGWPAAVTPPDGPVEQAVVLGLIRQESSFDIAAQSPVGARGLMQLMPATAAGVARRLGVAADIPALTVDAGYNMRLGTSYLHGLLGQFGALPPAIAGYNAGPSRVQDWLVAYGGLGSGDPKGGDMIDWIELIPFNETRNYVQRVIENIVIYRAQLGARGPHPVLPG